MKRNNTILKLNFSSKLLKMLLEKYVVVFEFEKVEDGSTRFAVGTRNLSYIPVADYPVGGSVKTTALPYYDFTVNEWRSLYEDNMIEIVDWGDPDAMKLYI